MVTEIFILLALAVLVYQSVSLALSYRRGLRSRGPATLAGEATAFPPVTVLIPAWCEGPTLRECLTAVQTVTYPAVQFIVIAGGNEETFDTAVACAAADARMTVLRQQPRGKNAALTDGLQIATGEVIVILDADSIVQPTWLADLVRPITLGASATCGNFIPRTQTWVSWAEQMEKLADFFVKRQCVFQGSASIAVRRDVLDKAGGFPEDVKVGVDWDLDRRLGHAGAYKVFVPTARVWTHRASTLGEFNRNERRWRRGQLALLRRYDAAVEGRPFSQRLNEFRFYIASVIAGLLALITMALVLFGPDSRLVLAIVAAVLAAMLLRRARIAAMAYGFSNDVRCVWLAWGPGVLQLVALSAGLYILAMPGRVSPFFKGPRPGK